MDMRFEWDDDKNRENLCKHDVRFETALLVFEDPHAITQRDSMHDEEEERFITLGASGPGSIVFVVHTWHERSGEECVRIISARAATAGERKSYESANKRTEAGHRRDRRKKR